MMLLLVKKYEEDWIQDLSYLVCIQAISLKKTLKMSRKFNIWLGAHFLKKVTFVKGAFKDLI